MHTKKNPEAAEDELITALFYLYQEALKKNAKLAQAIQAAIETGEKLGPSAPRSKSCEDILKQFYVMREFQKLDGSQKQLFLQQIDGFQAKTRNEAKACPTMKRSKHAV